VSNPRIDYVEYNVADIPRAKKFYGDAFGWTFTDYGPDYCEFNDGRIRGGLTTQGPKMPGGPLIVLHAANLEDASSAGPSSHSPAAAGFISGMWMGMSWGFGARSKPTSSCVPGWSESSRDYGASRVRRELLSASPFPDNRWQTETGAPTFDEARSEGDELREGIQAFPVLSKWK
jgi:hypothetical protein